MIKIERTDCPPILQSRLGPESEAYKNVRNDLWKMQYGKCCYCEISVPDSGQGEHIEHFKPKGKPEYTHLTNEWTNLLLACPQCNGQKGVQFRLDADGLPLLIDPSDDATYPEVHLKYVTDHRNVETRPLLGQILSADGDTKGEYTIETIQLDSTYHQGRRKKTLKQALHYVTDYHCATSDSDMEAARMGLRSLADDQSENAGIVRYLARMEEIDLS